MEMFNEYMILIIGLLELVILGFIDGFFAKQTVGNLMLFFILFMIGFNFAVAGTDFLKQMYKNSKRYYLY